MKHIALSALLICFANAAWGAGFQLRYQGAESMGTAFSSAGSYGTSLSSIYYNPALFLKQEKDRAASLELMVTNPTKAEFTSSTTGATEDDFASASLSGALYYGYRVDDETAITVAVTTPWGTDTDYGNAWEGRYHAIATDLAAVNIQPMMSKKLSDKFMFSIGPQIQYLSGSLSRATSFGPGGDLVSEFDGDDLSVGGVLALTYMMSEDTTLAFNYTSRVKHNLRGDLTFSPTALATAGSLVDSNDANAEITTPDVLTLSASHKMTEKMMGHFAVSYTNWSVFKDLTLVGNNAVAGVLPLVSSTEQNWEDTYMVSLGTTLNMSSTMTLRGGLSYETGAVDNAFRTPRSQDTDRIGLGLGASFSIGDSLNLDLGLNHIEYTGDIDMNIAAQAPTPTTPAGVPGVSGSYEASATLFRAGLEYTF